VHLTCLICREKLAAFAKVYEPQVSLFVWFFSIVQPFFWAWELQKTTIFFWGESLILLRHFSMDIQAWIPRLTKKKDLKQE